MGSHAAYRASLMAYSRSFRRRYGGDLVATFDELHRDRGGWTAWRRCLVDLCTAAPRTRAQAMAGFRPTTTMVEVVGTIVLAIVLVNFGGVLGSMVVFAAIASSATAVCMRTPVRRSVRRDPYGS